MERSIRSLVVALRQDLFGIQNYNCDVHSVYSVTCMDNELCVTINMSWSSTATTKIRRIYRYSYTNHGEGKNPLTELEDLNIFAWHHICVVSSFNFETFANGG